METEKLIEYWLTTAIYDLETASALLKAQRYPYALYMSHLALEKLLKAIYVKNKQEHAPYKHNLVRLANKAEFELTTEQTEFLAEVSEFNIEARYPDIKMAFYKKATKEYTQNYMHRIEEFFTCLKEQLEKS